MIKDIEKVTGARVSVYGTTGGVRFRVRATTQQRRDETKRLCAELLKATIQGFEEKRAKNRVENTNGLNGRGGKGFSTAPPTFSSKSYGRGGLDGRGGQGFGTALPTISSKGFRTNKDDVRSHERVALHAQDFGAEESRDPGLWVTSFDFLQLLTFVISPRERPRG